MNAVVCIVFASISLGTVKSIKRIPLDLFYKENAIKKHYTEELLDKDKAHNERTFNLVDGSDDKSGDSDKRGIGDLKFTDFILEAAKVLKTYENYDLQEAIRIIDYEVWRNMYKGCKSHELADIRRYVSDQLGLIKDEPAHTLRQYLDKIIDIIRNEDYGEVREIVIFVNSLYVGEYEEFIEVLLALVHRRISADVDLADILKRALKSLIFDHYCNLDNNVRHDLIKLIKHYWKQVTSQKLNNKIDRSLDTLSLVTPFLNENRYDQIHKKRRYNTVNKKRPHQRHETDNSKFSDESGIIRKMRAGSEDTVPGSVRTDSRKSIRKLNPKYRATSNQNELVTTNFTNENNEEILKTVTIDENSENVRSTKSNQVYEFEEPMNSPSSPQTPHIFQHQPNRTLEKLIKIGTLAKEINDIMALESKSMRSNFKNVPNLDTMLGPHMFKNVPNLDTILGPHMFKIMGDYGEITKPEMVIKSDGGNCKKDILISMKAKYEE